MLNILRTGHWVGLPFGVALALSSSALGAQSLVDPGIVATPPTTAAPQASPTRPAATSPVAPSSRKIPEGTEVKVRLDQPLSSATATAGDTFAISTDGEIRLADGTIIPAGYRGKGTVTAAEKRGMLGKAGQLNISLDYIRVGDVRVHLRASKGGEGKSGVTTTIVLSLLITPLFLMHHGHEMVFPKGQIATAYVDEDATIALPIAPAPRDD